MHLLVHTVTTFYSNVTDAVEPWRLLMVGFSAQMLCFTGSGHIAAVTEADCHNKERGAVNDQYSLNS